MIEVVLFIYGIQCPILHEVEILHSWNGTDSM